MKDWKITVKKLLYPPLWVMILLTVLCTTALIYTFMRGHDAHPAAYVTYVLSFYTLSVIVLACIKTFPQYYKNAKKRVYDHPVGGRFMTDMPFRTHVTLYCSLGVNLLYAAVNLFSGIWYRSVWFITLAVYYIILAVMRFLLVRFVNRIGIGKNQCLEFRRSRLCAVILLTLNLALSGVVILVIKQNKGFEYAGILIYVMAAYTFYITINAIVNIVKYHKYHSPVMTTAKVINLAAALVSMLSLETAMLSQFGSEENSPYFDLIMIGATGAGVSVIVLVMSVYMIVKSTKAINTMKKGI
ncbi:MAG: hypothetical protein IJX77_04675 [Ruminococcus sp.]|nr:hypothetical protein [Ruminococcus sp.]